MDEREELEYLARKIAIARAKSVLAIAEMNNEARKASFAIDRLAEAFRVHEIRLLKRIYDAWIILPYRKDNLN